MTGLFQPERHSFRVEGNEPFRAALRAGRESHGRPGRHIIMLEGKEDEEGVSEE